MGDGSFSAARFLAGVVLALMAAFAVAWAVSDVPADDSLTTSPAATTEGYVLWATRDDGTPVRWNPCRSIDWVLNTDGAPSDAQALAIEGFERIATVTGLDFRYLGTTAEIPTTQRQTVVDQYGTTSWAPVLVAWAPPDGATPLRQTDQALAIPIAVDGVFVSGQIILNSDIWLASDFSARSQSWGAALVHEAGHLVGLDHVDDPTQLMYRLSGEGPVRFGTGDLAGLRAIGAGAGSGGCLDPGTPRLIDVHVQERRTTP